MTSSNAAPTGEGRAAVAKPSPPPDHATSAALPTDADASDAAATNPGTSGATIIPDASAPATEAPPKSKPTDEAEAVVPPFSLADLPGSQMQPDQLLNGANADFHMPSPPTVSPLSTPAATNVNVDESLPDEIMARLAADVPPLSLTRDASMFRSGIFGPQQSDNAKTAALDAMELDEPYIPEETSYHRRNQLQAIATTDPDPHGAEYSSHSMLRSMRLSQGSIDPSAYMMNLATQATHFNDHGPSVIDPSAVSLQSLTQGSEVLTGSAGSASLNESQKLESFAKIEFADSTFQMTTYAVIIGRDQQALEQARADERREAAYRRRCEENERNGLPPPTPVVHDRGKFSKSYVSEEGGMLGPEHSDGEDTRPAKRRRPSSAVQFPAGEDNISGDHVQSNRQYVSHTPGAAAVDMGALQPSPDHIPFIGIHSPGPDIASKTRGISRQHLKIQFNKKRGVFEGIALHKNGFFCEDILYGLDNPATLRSGDRLQIKDVEFFFVINGVQIGMSGGEDEDVTSTKLMSVGGKEMSLDFEHSDHENFKDTSDELSDVENISTPINESGRSDGEPEPAPVPAPAPKPQSTIEPPQQEIELEATPTQPVASEERQLSEAMRLNVDMPTDIPPEFAMPDIPRRRGPGRPPKDGIMSKRERRLLKKQLQETSKKALPQDPQEEKIKRPVGRPRKNPLPEDGEQTEKRKYNKKKREDGEGGSDVEKRVKEKKDKKVRPKSPPLDLRREDYTAEQLQKPTKNYGVLIDEALTNGPPDGLTLKQIYKRITAKYPWFFFTAETKGWESSVRHNLIGNEAFKKDEETGLWSRVPGVELDAGKKRKVNSPDRHLGPSHLHPHLSHTPYYQTSPYSNAGTVTYAHGLPSYSAEQKHLQSGHTPIGQNSQLQSTTSQSVTPPVYTPHVPAPAQLPAGYGNLGLSRPPNAPQQSTYSSPYARPPPPANPLIKSETGLANGQASIASSTALPATTTPQPQPRLGPANKGSREQLSPDIERAIAQFSTNMLDIISERTPHAAVIIEAAANKIRGLPVQNKVPAGFESVETTLVNAMQVMIKDMRRSHQHATSASPAPTVPVQTSTTPSPAPHHTVEAEIQRRLRNFRESMVTALRTKTDKAEIVVDSAINRARGLPHAGKIPGWEEADNLMVKSVTQIIEEARSAYNLKVQTTQSTVANGSRTVSSQPVQTAPRREPPASLVSAQTPSGSSMPPGPSSSGTTKTPYATNAHPPIPSIPNSNTASTTRLGMPLQRPAPVAFTRPPTTGSMARPASALHKELTTAPAMTSAAVSPAPRSYVSNPAPPSAGVLDQITGHKRFTDDASHKSHGINNFVTGGHTGNNTGVSSNAIHTSSGILTNSSPAGNTAPSGTTASSVTGPVLSREGGNTTGAAIGNGANGSVNKPINHVSGSVADKSASSAPTDISSAPTSSALGNVGSNATGTSLSDTVGRPADSASRNTPAKPTNSALGNITSQPISGALSNAVNSPTNSAPCNALSMPASSATSGPTGHATSITANSSTSNNVGNRTTIAESTASVNATENKAARNASGDTSKLATGHNMNTASDTTGKAGSLENATAGNVTSLGDKAVGDTQGNSVGPTLGHNPGNIINTDKDIASDVNSKTGAFLDRAVGAGTSKSIGESENGKVGTENNTRGDMPTMEHQDPTALKTSTPVHNMSSPAPPSAGVVDQIAGHKRSLDEGPGSANGEQPVAKKRHGVLPV